MKMLYIIVVVYITIRGARLLWLYFMLHFCQSTAELAEDIGRLPSQSSNFNFYALNAGYKPAELLRHKFPLRSNLRQD